MPFGIGKGGAPSNKQALDEELLGRKARYMLSEHPEAISHILDIPVKRGGDKGQEKNWDYAEFALMELFRDPKINFAADVTAQSDDFSILLNALEQGYRNTPIPEFDSTRINQSDEPVPSGPRVNPAAQAPGHDVWEGGGGRGPKGAIKGRGGRIPEGGGFKSPVGPTVEPPMGPFVQNMSDDDILNDMSGMPLGWTPEEEPMPKGMEQLYNDPDWQEYDYLTDGHGNIEEFQQWKNSGKPDLFQENSIGTNSINESEQILMQLLQKFGMERDFSGGNIRPTDFGDESIEFGDEGMNYPGRPDYYKSMGGPGRWEGHAPVWGQGSELPPLSPEIMNYMLNNNPPNAIPTEKTNDDDQPGTRYEQDRSGRIINEHVTPEPVEVNRSGKGDRQRYNAGPRFRGRISFKEGGYSEHPKGDAEIPDRSDYAGTKTPEGNERMTDVLQQLGQGGMDAPLEQAQTMGDMGYNLLRGFMESPQGIQAYDVWRQTGDPTELLEMFKEFNEPSYIDPNQLLD